ncbi:MAG: hypothetical protein GDA53_01895 [Rhodobacteraceae bacterium]|nr:hypothetical protein [Paracoccaceae bacterium]
MTETGKTPDVAGALSSIRRLVSEQARFPDAAEGPPFEENGPLLLTPSMRVPPGAGGGRNRPAPERLLLTLAMQVPGQGRKPADASGRAFPTTAGCANADFPPDSRFPANRPPGPGLTAHGAAEEQPGPAAAPPPRSPVLTAKPESDVNAGTDSPTDEEVLREIVSDLVRSELQGALGDRITRNVRRLVRREIRRALEGRDSE